VFEKIWLLKHLNMACLGYTTNCTTIKVPKASEKQQFKLYYWEQKREAVTRF